MINRFKLTAVLFFALLISSTTFAQVELKANMGINYTSTPSLYDYLNRYYAPSDEQINSFTASVIFQGEVGYYLSKNYQLALETAVSINSFSYFVYGKREMNYTNIMPSVIGYYVLPGLGYNIKFGAGIGPRFFTVTESFTLNTADYSSTGFGVLLRAEGNTRLGKNFMASIGANVRYDFNGEPESNGKKIYNNGEKEYVNFNSLSIGLHLGISITL